ncbi:MAG TPA: hypothetical protein VJ506_07790 [Candidatus Limnocylindrales bacterium]|nr:hypothetical protein [Candidatus Limnocylindrales bacterium]
MRRRIIAATSAAALALSLYAGSALAANPPGTGQPSQDCADQTSSPPGFNTAGFAHAESVYANPDAQGGISSGNTHVVAQYDVACFQVSQH